MRVDSPLIAPPKPNVSLGRSPMAALDRNAAGQAAIDSVNDRISFWPSFQLARANSRHPCRLLFDVDVKAVLRGCCAGCLS